MISFFVPMIPKAKQSDRSHVATSKTGKHFVAHYKDTSVKQAEFRIEQFALPHKPVQPLEGGLFLILKAYSEPADSYSTKKQNACLRCEIWPTGKPDADNLCKLVLDALGTSKLFFKNDSQFVFVVIIKMYARQPGIAVKIGGMNELPGELRALSDTFEKLYPDKIPF